MPLSASLRNVELTFECPSCGYALVKTGYWFQTISRFKCEGCQVEILLGYPDKVALFERHGHLA
jgi:transposase-like protein